MFEVCAYDLEDYQGAAMKGMVFTEFLDMVELKFSAEMVDDII